MASHDFSLSANQQGLNQPGLAQLNERSREIFRLIVESYLATGEPVGSRNLSRILPMTLSPASVRNVMSDLEQLGLVYAPHTSAGRLPTEIGLRFFVDALMQIGDLSESGWHPDLVVAFESWPDQYSSAGVIRLLSLAPLARFVCVSGPWCESAGRTHAVWPLAVRVPVAGVKELTLEVEFGQNGDVQDVVNWADARLVR